MLRFESVFWATTNNSDLVKKLEKLGFQIQKSTRDPHCLTVFFGPESLEIFEKGQPLSSLSHLDGLEAFLAKGPGIFGLGLESDHIADDYRRLKSQGLSLEKPRMAKDISHEIPLWTGFSLPDTNSPVVKSWVVMNSPEALKGQSQTNLPYTHPNGCFGIEAVHLVADDCEAAADQWGKLVQKHISKVQWTDLEKTSGRRIQSGERFLDIMPPTPKLLAAAGGRNGVFMITLKVNNIESVHKLAQEAGADPQPCLSRDGFIVPPRFTGGPAIRFVRAFWKRYLPPTGDNYPLGRRTDRFRPLGGAYSSTLRDGFEDNWKY